MSSDSTKKKSLLAGLIAATVSIAAIFGLYITITSTSNTGNVSPTIIFAPVINTVAGQVVFINATISDPDGIKSTTWAQILGPTTNLTTVQEDLYFTPPKNATYVFSLEVEDNKDQLTVTSIPVVVGNSTTTDPVPPPPIPNKPPVVEVDSPIKCVVGSDCSMTATISDPDDGVKTVIWNQESGKSVSFDVSDDKWVVTFKPSVADTYVFSVEAQDNTGAATLKSITVNVPEPIPIPPPKPTCTADQVYNPTTNKCDPKPTPTPSDEFSFTAVGDIQSGTAGQAVFDQIKKQNSKYDFVLGDLGYTSDLKWFKSTYGSLGDKMFCVVGNHEAANEDGSSSIQKETQEFCGDSYWIKEGSTVFMLFNSNGDTKTQGTIAGNILQNTTFMNGVKNVFFLSHKPCVTPPNSHHPAGEIKALCDTLKSKTPSNVKSYYIQAHNHVMSSSSDGQYKQSGAGGKSHYTCGTSTQFPFCDNAHYGFLKVTIAADGIVTSKFIDSKGSEVTGIK